MKVPFFSVITPNYNSGSKLLRATKSLSGTKVSFEHIIVDDCSKDEPIDPFLHEIHWTRILRNEKNLGPGPSRNKGLRAAKGRYIIFLDSDDVLVPGSLDFIHEVLELNNCPDVLIFGYQLVRDVEIASIEKLGRSNDFSVCLHDNDSLIRKYLLDEIVSAPWGKCISSDLAKRVEFPDLRVSQDSFYNLDVFVQAKSAALTERKLYVFEKAGSTSLTSKSFTFSEYLKFQKSWNAFESKVVSDNRLSAYRDLLYARKIKFCVRYYMNRLALTPRSELDARVLKAVKSFYWKNIWRARNGVSFKDILLSSSFCLFPDLTLYILKLKLLRARN